ncbi:hypothetical protein [Mycolicibacterium sp. S3B2]|uniref:hypothetical protein n=1 Tax=Mycolicibacterium sp. S3B2 TaxID=3415120 RepID=UPI003C7BFEE5
MVLQRTPAQKTAEVPATEFPPWTVPGPVPLPEPNPATDRYVTVDEQVGDKTGVVAAPWPTVEAELGLLRFPPEPQMKPAWYVTEDLQKKVDQLRQKAVDVEGDEEQQPRPLRIGDTFWVRSNGATENETSYSEDLKTWVGLRDITPQARASAKAAVARAVLGAQPVPEVENLHDDGTPAAPDRENPDDGERPDETDTPGPAPGGAATARPTI